MLTDTCGLWLALYLTSYSIDSHCLIVLLALYMILWAIALNIDAVGLCVCFDGDLVGLSWSSDALWV